MGRDRPGEGSCQPAGKIHAFTSQLRSPLRKRGHDHQKEEPRDCPAPAQAKCANWPAPAGPRVWSANRDSRALSHPWRKGIGGGAAWGPPLRIRTDLRGLGPPEVI